MRGERGDDGRSMTSYARGTPPRCRRRSSGDLLDLSDDDHTLPVCGESSCGSARSGGDTASTWRRSRWTGRAFVKFARDGPALSQEPAADERGLDLHETATQGRAIDRFRAVPGGAAPVAAHRGVAHDRLVAFVLKQHGLPRWGRVRPCPLPPRLLPMFNRKSRG